MSTKANTFTALLGWMAWETLLLLRPTLFIACWINVVVSWWLIFILW